MKRKFERLRGRRAAAPEAAEGPESRFRPRTEARDPRELRIAFVQQDEGGCGWYRIIDPARQIEREGLADVVFPGNELETYPCDVVVFQRVFDPADRDRMVRLKRRGLLVVYDLDDAVWLMGPELLNPAYPHYAQGGRMDAHLDCLQEADLVTVTTEALAEEIRRRHDHVEVLPNRLLLGRYDQVKETVRFAGGEDRTIIGWTGSATHERDFRMVLPALVEVDEAFAGKLLWRFMGEEKSLWRIAEALTENPVEVFPWRSFAEHPAYLRAMRLDVGICPLWPHPFNAMKSPVKALEYSAAGAAVIASDFGPYEVLAKDEAVLCSTQEAWKLELMRLIEEPETRRRLAAKLLERVKREFALEGAGGEWVEVYWRHLLRIRGQEERWLFHSRRWNSPLRRERTDRLAEVERRASRR